MDYRMRTPSGQEINPAAGWSNAEPLYSAVEIDDGSIQVLTAFSYGIGAVVPGSDSRLASRIDTNLEGEGGRLPWTEEALIYAIGVEFYLDGAEGSADNELGGATQEPDISLENMLRLQQSLLLSWRSTYTTELLRAPVSYFPGGTGVASVRSGYITDSTTGGDPAVAAYNGGVSAKDRRMLSTPIWIPSDDTFAIDITAAGGEISDLDLSGAASRIYTRIFLHGYRRQPR